jgi:hypothetical protein
VCDWLTGGEGGGTEEVSPSTRECSWCCEALISSNVARFWFEIRTMAIDGVLACGAPSAKGEDRFMEACHSLRLSCSTLGAGDGGRVDAVLTLMATWLEAQLPALADDPFASTANCVADTVCGTIGNFSSMEALRGVVAAHARALRALVQAFLASADGDVLRECLRAFSSLMHVVACVEIDDSASMDAATTVAGVVLSADVLQKAVFVLENATTADVVRAALSFLINAACALPSCMRCSEEDVQSGSSLAPAIFRAMASLPTTHRVAEDSTMVQLLARLAEVLVSECPAALVSDLVSKAAVASDGSAVAADDKSPTLLDALVKVCGCAPASVCVSVCVVCVCVCLCVRRGPLCVSLCASCASVCLCVRRVCLCVSLCASCVSLCVSVCVVCLCVSLCASCVSVPRVCTSVSRVTQRCIHVVDAMCVRFRFSWTPLPHSRSQLLLRYWSP